MDLVDVLEAMVHDAGLPEEVPSFFLFFGLGSLYMILVY